MSEANKQKNKQTNKQNVRVVGGQIAIFLEVLQEVRDFITQLNCTIYLNISVVQHNTALKSVGGTP